MRKTKIIVTLGPATQKEEIITRMIKAGVNVFRLNFSHGDHSYHRRLIGLVRKISDRLHRPVAVLQDISGPKVRVVLEKPLILEAGENVHLRRIEVTGSEPLSIGINLPEMLSGVEAGQQIYFADGTIRTEVMDISRDRILLRVLVGGTLTHGKGVNIPVIDFNVSPLTDKDRHDIIFGIEQGVDIIALSFVRSAEDIKAAKALMGERGSETPLFAKIEKAEALLHLDDIVEAADGIMIARGDLGVELGVHRVPILQKKIIKKASGEGIPVITATQMLTSMISSPYPTRAEVSDIANAVLDGTDAVMLSDETTVGKYPEEAVKTLIDTIVETESCYPWFRECHDVRETRRAIAAAAIALAQRTEAEGIISFTETGLSALMVARQRPRTRTLAVTSNPKTYRRLAIVWGVEPFLTPRSYINSDEAIYHFFRDASAGSFVDLVHPFVVTIGRHSDKSGSTNVVQLVDQACMAELTAFFGAR
jgi:pyruvate kinase